ncbi:MAG: NADPH-dependent FMN reductase [Chromatocurvus sp.]
MKTGIISGSHRPQSQSEKVARVIGDRLEKSAWCEHSWLLTLADNPLPFWDESVWTGGGAWEDKLPGLREQVQHCDAFVIVTPEWHGMVPSGLKNFFLLWAAGGELAHKPALIVSVSASDNGAYPIAELRMSSYKNSRVCYLPEHLIVRNVKRVFNSDDDNDPKAHAYLSGRLDYCLGMLGEYAGAFRQIRDSGRVSLETYSNGM